MDEKQARWWTARLYSQLMLRNRRTEKFERYYSGEFDTPWLPAEAQDDFKRIVHMTRSNYMGLVVDAMVERMNLIGFRREGEGDDDKDLWAIWKGNRISTQHNKGLIEAAIHGCFYYMVEPPAPKRPDLPRIYVESPTQCIVEHVPGTNRREAAAGLKAWIDEWTGMIYATLYLPDMIIKWQAKNPNAGNNELAVEMPGEQRLAELMNMWRPRDTEGEAWVNGNPLGEVPLIESPNNPRLLTGGRSELDDLWPVQDRVNKTIADRMITQDYGAFPQKWSTGWPAENEDGSPVDPLLIGRKRIITTDVVETKFGQFEAAALDPYSAAKREDVIDIASRSRTPPHYLISGLSSQNSTTLKAAESGLVSKVTQRNRDHSDSAVDAIRLAGSTVRLELGDDIEALWANPEFRTQAETTDSLIKMKQAADMPTIVVWEKWGATPPEIERWKKLRDEEKEEEMQRATLYDPATALAEQMRTQQDPQDGYVSGDDQKNGDPLPGGGKPADDPQKVNTPNGVTA